MEKYYNKGTEVYRVRADQDYRADDPRNWSNVGHMMVWWGREKYGDVTENTFNDADEFLTDFVRTHCEEKQILDYIGTHETSRKLKIVRDMDDAMWELNGIYYNWCTRKNEFGLISNTDQDETWLVDDVIDCLTVTDMLNLITEMCDIVIIPLFMYEHSGMTISCSNGYPYNDRFDGGACGFIYVEKSEVAQYVNDDVDWKAKATEWLKDEVNTYDMYLRGDVYWIGIDQLTKDEFGFADWDTVESVGGYYSEKYGDELLEEMLGGFEDVDEIELCDTVREALVKARDVKETEVA